MDIHVNLNGVAERIAALDIVRLGHEGARSLLTGWIALEMNRIDPSHGTFYGVHSGLATGTIRTFGSDYMKENMLPAMLRRCRRASSCAGPARVSRDAASRIVLDNVCMGPPPQRE